MKKILKYLNRDKKKGEEEAQTNESLSSGKDGELAVETSSPSKMSSPDDEIPVDDFVPVEGLPPDKTMLSSQTMDELVHLCQHVNIDYSAFTTKEEYVDALQARYPKEKLNRGHSARVTDVAAFLDSGAKAQANNIKVDDLFTFLLNKLKVERDLQKKIMAVYTVKEKVSLLGECVSILDDDPNFTERDEDLIHRLYASKSVDSLHILAVKFRVQHSHEEWRQYFTAAGGVSVLVQLILNSTETMPLLDFDASTLFEVMLCLKIFIKSDGIKSVSETRGAIDAMCLSLDFNHNFLVIQTLELLSVIAAYGGDDAIWQVAQGIQHVARLRQEKPFACFAAAMIERDIDIQVAVVSFINTYMMSMKDLEERISTRGHLYSAKFNQVLDFLVVLDGDETVVGFSADMSAALLESIERQPSSQSLLRAGSLNSMQTMGSTQSTKLQQAYEEKYGRTRSVDAENRMLMGDGKAEDDETPINPSAGIMAGYCYESKKHKEGVKRRWYSLKGNVFKWYHPEKKLNGLKGEKENGSISIVDVQEILEYSTAGNLQNISRCGFVIKTNKAAPEDRYQIGVEDELTKRRWITALRCARNNILSLNAAFRIEKTTLNTKEQKALGEKLKKHINVFNLVESEDLTLIRDECNNLSYLTSDDDWNDVASIVRYLCFEIISTGNQNDLKDILQNIISLYDQYRQDHQRYATSVNVAAKKYATISDGSSLKGSGSSKLRGGASSSTLSNARSTAQLAAAVAASKIAARAAAGLGASAVEASTPSFGRRRSISTLTYRLSARLASVGNAAEANASHDAAVDLWREEDNPENHSKKEELRQRQEERKKAVKQSFGVKADDSMEPAYTVAEKDTISPSTNAAESESQPDGKAALMAMIAARGPRLPPPPVALKDQGTTDSTSADTTAESETGGKAALMAMIAARGPRLPPPPVASTDEKSSADAAEPGGKSALMAMIAARGPRLPPPQRPAEDSASSPAPPMPPAPPGPFGLRPRGPVVGPSEADLKRIAEEEAENAKYPAKPEYHPERKMRSLFWTKLKPSEAASTIWSDVSDVELDWSELEDLFCDEKAVAKAAAVTPPAAAAKVASPAPGEVGGIVAAAAVITKEKLRNVSLFDGKRTQNVSIGIKKLRMTPQEIVDTILNMDPQQLTKEVTNTLLLLAPNSTEIAVIQGYGGSPDELDLVGQLFHEMLRVPRAAQRLEIMKSTHEWLSGYDQLFGEVETMKMSVEELLSKSTTGSLHDVLAKVLAAGNYLNAGTARSRAHGVKLDILVKLANLKQNGNPKATLLHYVVEKSSSRGDDSQLFYSGWCNIWNAPRINARQLETDIRALAGDINIMKAEKTRFTSNESSSISAEVKEPLVKRITVFLSQAEPKLSQLQENCKDMLKAVADARDLYGESKNGNDGEDPVAAFFSLVVTFAEMYSRAYSDINAWAEEADKMLKIEEKKKKANRPKSIARQALDTLTDDSSTVTSELNVFDRLKVSQSGEPEEFIATFQHNAIPEGSSDSEEDEHDKETEGHAIFGDLGSDSD